MSEADIAQLRENYTRARLAWEKAKAALLTAKAALEAARREREETDKRLVEGLLDRDRRWSDNVTDAGVLAIMTRDVQRTEAALETATRQERETARTEQETLKALVGVI